MNCKICQKPEAQAGPLDPSGICLDCEREIEKRQAIAGIHVAEVCDGEIIRVAAPDNSPLAIINRAVELKMSAAELQALVALHNSQEDRRARAAFQQAMVRCQQELPTVVRDRTNPKTQSGFASLDRINVLAHPVYTKHGFYVSFREEEAAKDGWIRTVAEIGHVEGHRQEAYLELPHDGIGPQGNAIGGMNRIQGAISSGSYGQRVLLCRLFNIAIANTDHDGEVFIEEEDAAECQRIIQKIKMTAVQYKLWLDYVGVKPADPVKPSYSDIRSMYRGMFAGALDDLQRREREFDRQGA